MNVTIDPKIAVLDHERFCQAVDVVREHNGIDSQREFAETMGVDPGVIQRLRKGEGVQFESMIRILAYTRIDVRNYIVAQHDPAKHPHQQ